MTSHHYQRRINELLAVQTDPVKLLEWLEAKTPLELNELLPGLSSTGTAGEERKALRDAIQTVLYRKLSGSLLDAMNRLDRSTAQLTKVGWWLTIVVGVAGIVVSIAGIIVSVILTRRS